MSLVEINYINILKNILENGEKRLTRNSYTLSIFGENLKIDLREGFPLITTKKMFLRGIIEELLFFIKGNTNTKELEDKKVNIWKGNTSRCFLDSLNMYDRNEGLMGPMYGYQWRFYNSKYCNKSGINLEKGIDQLENLINLIKNDPFSRRLLLTSYNPIQANDGVLYPCHSIILQFYCDSNNNLDVFCYNRSQDIFHGVPFNIASTSILLMIIAKLTNKTPRFVHISMGDVHIYESHIESVKKQINRIPYSLPTLSINSKLDCLEDLNNLTVDNFILDNYISHPSIKVDMVV